jgi:hypothetical protein
MEASIGKQVEVLSESDKVLPREMNYGAPILFRNRHRCADVRIMYGTYKFKNTRLVWSESEISSKRSVHCSLLGQDYADADAVRGSTLFCWSVTEDEPGWPNRRWG